jgi:hypothetical protein
MTPLRGSFWVLILYDVAERIELEPLRKILGVQPSLRQPSFKNPAPDYVRFERPPVIEHLDPVTIESGEVFARRIKYFDYGVISVEYELQFEAGWDELVRNSSRWITAPEIESRSEKLARSCIDRVGKAVFQRYKNGWLSEDFYIIQLSSALDEAGRPLKGSEMLALHGGEIVQIVRGESLPLADNECREALQASLSYYPNDLIVVGWVAALVYDTPAGAAPAIQLLEYANTQLLEFRHYDDLLTRVLEDVYKYLERRGGLFRRWRTGREAERLNTILLDVRELTERTDNAIKFLSDMFYARAYRIASERVGVTDYRNLVEEKLRIAAELYQSMVSEFHEARAFVLEVMVVAILVIELVHLFQGNGR